MVSSLLGGNPLVHRVYRLERLIMRAYIKDFSQSDSLIQRLGEALMVWMRSSNSCNERWRFLNASSSSPIVPFRGRPTPRAAFRACALSMRTQSADSCRASEAPRAPARGICGKAKRNSAEATRLRPAGYAAVACRHSSPCFHTGHPGEGE